MSNLIPITKIYDIYPKYTFSKDVMRFMDDIVDIPRVEVFTKDEVIDMLEKLKKVIESQPTYRMAITDFSGLNCYGYSEREPSAKDAAKHIQAKINALRGDEDEHI